MRRFLSALTLTSCMLAGLPSIALANGLPGLALWSGIERQNQLSYRLDFGGQTNDWDRYNLRVPQKKMSTAVERFVITYPDYYEGTFNPKDIEVEVGKKKVALSEVKWDKKGHVLEIFPSEPVPAGKNINIVLSNVKNPAFGGIFYFNLSVQSPGDIPLTKYIGTWMISIG